MFSGVSFFSEFKMYCPSWPHSQTGTDWGLQSLLTILVRQLTDILESFDLDQ